ncbi:hypothetical protein [Leptothermofonsia sp. ETS-13]|uniref:hypothetical protein n=1 Tax=Leptothermofonsia sp. ETS-13 TaxID=3035696 RepID=UPI003B9F886B
MEIGDIVRLRKPFRARSKDSKEYTFGIVAALIWGEGEEPKQTTSSTPIEILVYLYDPETATTYTDEAGMQAVFIFRSDEIEFD